VNKQTFENMKCPNCNETLVMADRQGVEVDYCPACRGVWLDRGELDKIIERSTAYYAKPEAERDRYDEEAHRKQYPSDGGYRHDPYYKHKKKKGFFGDFFDFD
jgi:uncharacterized protein